MSYKEANRLIQDSIIELASELSLEQAELLLVTKEYDGYMVNDFPGRIETNQLRLARRRMEELQKSCNQKETQITRLKSLLKPEGDDHKHRRIDRTDRQVQGAAKKKRKQADSSGFEARSGGIGESADPEDSGKAEPFSWSRWTPNQH